MALSPAQTAEATKVYHTAIQGGLPPERAKEIVLAAFHESSLNPDAVNPESGAAGDMQLLSSGYVDKAKQLGGLHNTEANVGAILPDYERYWQQHPNAPIGAGAAAVERSGQGAGFYGANADLLNFLGSKGGAAAPPSLPGRGAGPAPIAPGGQDARTTFALTIAQNIGKHGGLDSNVIGQALQQLHASMPELNEPQTPVAGPGSFATDHASGDLHARFGIPVADLSSVGGLHPTEGLNGYPAHDYFAPAGSPVVAPITGTVIKLSGHDPALGPIEGPHGPLGWSVYIKGADGRTYYLTHLGSRDVKVGEKLHTGEPIGTVADYAKYGTPSHVHQGVSAPAA